MMVQLFDKWK